MYPRVIKQRKESGQPEELLGGVPCWKSSATTPGGRFRLLLLLLGLLPALQVEGWGKGPGFLQGWSWMGGWCWSHDQDAEQTFQEQSVVMEKHILGTPGIRDELSIAGP